MTVGGSVWVDAGAQNALSQGKSLLPAGVMIDRRPARAVRE